MLQDYVSYNPETGVFTRLVSTNNRSKAGDTAGYVNKLGYTIIVIEGVRYYAHRLAFVFMGQEMPKVVDHIDGNPANNAWSNLRPCTPRQNSQNRKTPKDNTSGVKGVCWNKQANKWHTQIRVDGKSKYLGLFDNLDDAAEAVRVARAELHGDFTRH